MAIDGSSSSPPVLAKRDYDGDVDMGDLSPENVSQVDATSFFPSLCATSGPVR